MKGCEMKIGLLMFCVAAVSAAGTVEEGFTSLFNGRDLAGWTGDKNAYRVEDGAIVCGPWEGVKLKADDALMTEKEYADFILRFECMIEKGADNGLGIRYPGVGDMAYTGIEMQLADTRRATDRKDLWRTMGGYYGVSDALDDRTPCQKEIGATYVKPCGEWNAVELRAEGPRVTAWLNGVKVNDCDLSTRSPDTGFDKHSHAGVRAKKGHIIWWVGNTRATVRWRNIRIKELRRASEVDPACRRFLYSDFMNRKLVYVDEGNPAAYWEAFVPEIAFDISRAGLHRMYVSQRNGWREYTLAQLEFVREIKDAATIKQATGVCEGPNGNVYVLEQRGLVHEYTRDGKWLFTYSFPPVVRHGRAIRFTNRGTALLGIDDGVAEVKLDKNATPEARLLRTFTIPGSKSAYQGMYLEDGNILVTGGYLPELVRFATDGTIKSRMKSGQKDGLADFFYGGFDFRRNGNVLLANWTGHNGRDFIPGWKLIEFDLSGKVVWHWNAPWAGTPCAVMSFD